MQHHLDNATEGFSEGRRRGGGRLTAVSGRASCSLSLLFYSYFWFNYSFYPPSPRLPITFLFLSCAHTPELEQISMFKDRRECPLTQGTSTVPCDCN